MRDFDPAAARVAAAYLREQDHLAKGVYVDTTGCFCTTGAYLAALYGRDSIAQLSHSKLLSLAYLLEAVQFVDSKFYPVTDIYRWNDKEGRTLEEAARLLEKAAELWPFPPGSTR
jgi:hypothetical protein